MENVEKLAGRWIETKTAHKMRNPAKWIMLVKKESGKGTKQRRHNSPEAVGGGVVTKSAFPQGAASDSVVDAAADGPGGLDPGGAGLGQASGDARAVAGGKQAGQSGLQI